MFCFYQFPSFSAYLVVIIPIQWARWRSPSLLLGHKCISWVKHLGRLRFSRFSSQKFHHHIVRADRTDWSADSERVQKFIYKTTVLNIYEVQGKGSCTLPFLLGVGREGNKFHGAIYIQVQGRGFRAPGLGRKSTHSHSPLLARTLTLLLLLTLSHTPCHSDRQVLQSGSGTCPGNSGSSTI